MNIEVKICGLTNLEDATVAVDAGANYLGFVFYARSPRAVTADQVAPIVTALGSGVRAVGVFVDATPTVIRDIVEHCGLYAVQLHGAEDPNQFKSFPVPVWRALAVDVNGCSPEPTVWNVSRFLADAAAPGVYGGSGNVADWEQAKQLATRVPLMLAGGLNATNVAAAIETVRPLGVDVSSGVEACPGKKSHEDVRAFIASAKATADRLAD